MISNREAGFALLIVLWSLVLLALLGSQMMASARMSVQIARNLRDGATTDAAMRCAVQDAVFELLARRWAADGTAHRVRIGPSETIVQVEDEDGKVNPNIASEALLRALLVRAGAPPNQAGPIIASIIDWRSPEPQARSGGMKAAAYAAAGLDYGPPSSDFRSVEEVGNVLGVTPVLMARLRPHLTVFSDSNPDGGTRDPIVLAALTDSGEVIAEAADQPAQVASITVFPQTGGAGLRAVVRLVPIDDAHPYAMLSLDPESRRDR